jgi:hypothetical protein
MANHSDDFELPQPPTFSEEDLKRYRESGDFTPALFEWYKFVGSLAVVVAHIQKDSPAFRAIPSRHFHVLMGLVNRCARLMLSNVALSHQAKFGETTAIVDRCIFESAVKVIWLCENPSDENFIRYQADGLKVEVELKQHIEKNIRERGGDLLPIETRMLKSIQRTFDAAQLTEEQVMSSKKMQDLASILVSIGRDRLIYTVGQRIGSHHVHGTWPSLLFHYLEEEPEGSLEFTPRGNNCTTHINQFMYVALIVLDALLSYVGYALDDESSKVFSGLLNSTKEELMEFFTDAVGGDLTA